MKPACNKTIYKRQRDAVEAKKHAASWGHHRPENLRMYYCGRCQGWHLSSEGPIEAKASGDPYLARVALGFPVVLKQPPAEIMWMPGGVNEITASQGGKPVTATVLVNRETATVMQRTLVALRDESRQRPFFDFDHSNGPASSWPIGFVWRDLPEPGVYAQVEWSDSGGKAVVGKDYRAFSPSFYLDSSSPRQVTGAPINMGGIVNDPAFTNILPLWAKRPNSDTTMNKTKKLLALLASINQALKDRATLAAKPQDNAAAISAKDGEIQALNIQAEDLREEIEAEAQGSEEQTALTAKQSEIDALKAKNEELVKAQQDRAKADAKAAVDAAVASGAILAGDTDGQAKWLALITADPSAATLLASRPGNPALGGRIIPAGGNRIETVRAETKNVVKAYHDEPDPKKRGEIWRADIRARVEKQDDGVIIAANSLGSLAGDLIVQRSLDLLKLRFPILSRISTDFSSENASFGQTVKCRLRSVPSVVDYDTTNGYGNSDATTTDVPVTINAHKAVQLKFNANELASTRRLLFDEQEDGMHYALGKALVDALYALVLIGTYTNATTKALGTFDRTTVRAMAKALNARGVGEMNRSLLLNGDYFEALGDDASIIQLATFQKPEIITGYGLPPVAGFQPYEAVNLPTTANLTGFGFAPDAMAISTRQPNDYTAVMPGVTGGGVVSSITNPDTDMTVMVVKFIDHIKAAAFFRIALMFGVAPGQAASGQILKSA